MTTRRIKRVAPLQAGKMLAALYGCMGLIFLPFFLVAGMLGAFAQHSGQANEAAPAAVIGAMFFGIAIFLPIIYAIMGFIFGLIGAAIYNLIAGWIGGIEVEVE
jgi:hypothetical protein